MVMVDLEAVELKDELAVPDQTLVLPSAVRAVTTQEPLVPSAARLDVGHRNEGLWTH
jgi:hypothetical protein